MKETEVGGVSWSFLWPGEPAVGVTAHHKKDWDTPRGDPGFFLLHTIGFLGVALRNRWTLGPANRVGRIQDRPRPTINPLHPARENTEARRHTFLSCDFPPGPRVLSVAGWRGLEASSG